MDVGDPCPQCGGGELVVRMNRDTGEFFLGCDEYPECDYTEDIDPWTRRDETTEEPT